MNIRKVNRSVINLLRYLSDDKKITINKRRHICVAGTYRGKKKTFTLCHSPMESYYEQEIRSMVRRFIEPMDLDPNTLKIIKKKFKF